MRTYLLLFIIVIAALTSCSESEIAPHEDFYFLNEKLHGKYKIVTSTSNEAVDINRDGQTSTDLLQEISNLSEAKLEIRIYQNNNGNDNNFLFTQFWQQQFISPNTADIVINYALQGVIRNFKINNSLDQLLISPDKYQVDLKLFPIPDTVTIKDNEQIEIVMQKLIYTIEGWELLTITTVYKRYTRIT